MQAWQVLSTEYIIENRPYNSTRKERCRLPNGIEIDFYVHEYPDWVNAVVLTPDMDMVLVEQYRHGVMHCMTEIPAGMVEDGENPAEAIVREVAEETGYSSEKIPNSAW